MEKFKIIIPCIFGLEALVVSLLDERLAVGQPFGVEIADGHDPALVGILHHARHIHRRGDPAQADHADLDQFARGRLAEDRGGDDGREGRRGAGETGRFQKGTP